jgi:hypothetical protein
MHVINNISFPSDYLCLSKLYNKPLDIGSGLLVYIPQYFPDQQGDILEEVETAWFN